MKKVIILGNRDCYDVMVDNTLNCELAILVDKNVDVEKVNNIIQKVKNSAPETWTYDDLLKEFDFDYEIIDLFALRA